MYIDEKEIKLKSSFRAKVICEKCLRDEHLAIPIKVWLIYIIYIIYFLVINNILCIWDELFSFNFERN